MNAIIKFFLISGVILVIINGIILALPNGLLNTINVGVMYFLTDLLYLNTILPVDAILNSMQIIVNYMYFAGVILVGIILTKLIG